MCQSQWRHQNHGQRWQGTSYCCPRHFQWQDLRQREEDRLVLRWRWSAELDPRRWYRLHHRQPRRQRRRCGRVLLKRLTAMSVSETDFTTAARVRKTLIGFVYDMRNAL